MSELLVELLSEEIPARMQDRARRDFERLLLAGLDEAGLAHGPARSFATPRRLAVTVAGLPERQPDRIEERKGPRVGAPERALAGFLKAAGLESVEECEVRRQGRAEFYFARRRLPGRPAAEVLGEVVAAAIMGLSWPKSMRWGDGALRYVRPLRNLLAIFAGRALPGGVELGGGGGRLAFSDRTHGHRFMAPAPFPVSDFADYEAKLLAAHVVLDAEERVRRIRAGAPEGARLPARLLAENAGLTEWPVPGVGAFDPAFLDLPPEVLATAMETHQRYFAIEDGAGGLAPRFLFVANIAADDGNATIRAGNERVLRARLADARFFWDQDRARPLADRLPALDAVVFHAGLGSMGDKARRMERLAAWLAERVADADPALCREAARLAKADLVTGMVGEFPELQGVMGRYYALGEGLDAAVADALAEHYRPQGGGDPAPSAPVSVAVALADKFDTLAGFFSIDERPTGSRDPFALRRAALGIVRILLENGLRLPLREAIRAALDGYGAKAGAETLFAFFEDRLKAHLRERGARHDLVSAVFALGSEDDLVRLMARVAFLERFIDGEVGTDLLTAYRRAGNILAIEEKKDGAAYGPDADPAAFAVEAEHALHEALRGAGAAAAGALAAEDFGAATAALASLRAPVDRFFDEVTVNAEDDALRANRLRLLAGIRAATAGVADFSRIEG